MIVLVSVTKSILDIYKASSVLLAGACNTFIMTNYYKARAMNE